MPDASAANPETAMNADLIARAHQSLLTDERLQFERVTYTPPTPPDWLRWLAEWLSSLQPAMKWVFWAGLAALAGLVLFLIAREVIRLRRGPARPALALSEGEPAWRPDEAAARDLLAAADRLAAQGRFAEAAHLLLLRSVEDIERHRPRSLRVSLTTREIAGLRALPEAARPAFARIGRVVERSLFGGRAVDADDFADCRRAYEAFALPDGWTG
jgi:hypothetical protein